MSNIFGILSLICVILIVYCSVVETLLDSYKLVGIGIRRPSNLYKCLSSHMTALCYLLAILFLFSIL